jgi:hypothetical protein
MSVVARRPTERDERAPDAQKAGKAPAGGVADRLARRSAPATTIGDD